MGLENLLESRLQQIGVKILERDRKNLKALDKLSNYWKLCNRLVRLADSRKYRSLFAELRLNPVEHYSGRKVKGSYRYVHAEVQLATYHLLKSKTPFPRTIGTSKAACYLCNMFFAYQGRFALSATHGRLYDRWTIPDLLAYSINVRQQIRGIIRSMFARMTQGAVLTSSLSRPYPIESWIWHDPNVPSLTATILSSSDRETEQKPVGEITHSSLHEKVLSSKTSEVVTDGVEASSSRRSQAVERPTFVSPSWKTGAISQRGSSEFEPQGEPLAALDTSTANDTGTPSRPGNEGSHHAVDLPKTHSTRSRLQAGPPGSTAAKARVRIKTLHRDRKRTGSRKSAHAMGSEEAAQRASQRKMRRARKKKKKSVKAKIQPSTKHQSAKAGWTRNRQKPQAYKRQKRQRPRETPNYTHEDRSTGDAFQGLVRGMMSLLCCLPQR